VPSPNTPLDEGDSRWRRTGCMQSADSPGGLEGDMLRKNDSESSEPLADGLGRQVCRYSEGAAYNPLCGEIAACR